MAKKRKPAIKFKWQRGLFKDWDGWCYRIGNWSSGPYPTLKEAMKDARQQLKMEIKT